MSLSIEIKALLKANNVELPWRCNPTANGRSLLWYDGSIPRRALQVLRENGYTLKSKSYVNEVCGHGFSFEEKRRRLYVSK